MASIRLAVQTHDWNKLVVIKMWVFSDFCWAPALVRLPCPWLINPLSDQKLIVGEFLHEDMHASRMMFGRGLAIIGSMLAVTAQASLINPGFETGDFTGWSKEGAGGVIVVRAGEELLDPPLGARYAALLGNGDSIYSTISQTFTLNSGQMLTGWAAFSINPWHGTMFNADAFVKMTGSSGTTVLWESSYSWPTGGIPPLGETTDSSDQLWYVRDWSQWSFMAPENGVYTLSYGCRSDFQQSTVIGSFDTASVPDGTSSLLLLVMSLIGLLALKQKLAQGRLQPFS